MPRSNTFSLIVLSMILGALISFGCVQERLGKRSSLQQNTKIYDDANVYTLSTLDSRFNMDPPVAGDISFYSEDEEDAAYDPLKKYSSQTYLGDDGTITRHYYLPPGRGTAVANLLVSHVPKLKLISRDPADPNKPVNLLNIFNTRGDGSKLRLQGQDAEGHEGHVLVAGNVMADNRPSKIKGMSSFANYNHATGAVADLLVVKTKGKEKLMAIDSFLTSLLNEMPIIEIKVRVVEISVSDAYQWGLQNNITRDTTSNKYFLKNWQNIFHTESFTRAGNEAFDFQGTLFNAFGIHDKFQLDATFELLQRVTDADILSAPTIAVLNGHRAIIETGDKVPKQEIVATADTAFYNYKYEQTGVKLVIVPYLLPGNMIEVHVNAEVVAVTGRETFDTPVGALSQPILANRQASTRLRIKEGQAFALGGLMATTEFDIVSKLPLLGDIPIVGLLFKSKSVEKEKSQIIFYIEPHVVTREDGWKKRGKE
jgi:type II secretory pathway component GspD/PulD (secretin)